jgi:hypothetical protein
MEDRTEKFFWEIINSLDINQPEHGFHGLCVVETDSQIERGKKVKYPAIAFRTPDNTDQYVYIERITDQTVSNVDYQRKQLYPTHQTQLPNANARYITSPPSLIQSPKIRVTFIHTCGMKYQLVLMFTDSRTIPLFITLWKFSSSAVKEFPQITYSNWRIDGESPDCVYYANNDRMTVYLEKSTDGYDLNTNISVDQKTFDFVDQLPKSKGPDLFANMFIGDQFKKHNSRTSRYKCYLFLIKTELRELTDDLVSLDTLKKFYFEWCSDQGIFTIDQKICDMLIKHITNYTGPSTIVKYPLLDYNNTTAIESFKLFETDFERYSFSSDCEIERGREYASPEYCVRGIQISVAIYDDLSNDGSKPNKYRVININYESKLVTKGKIIKRLEYVFPSCFVTMCLAKRDRTTISECVARTEGSPVEDFFCSAPLLTIYPVSNKQRGTMYAHLPCIRENVYNNIKDYSWENHYDHIGISEYVSTFIEKVLHGETFETYNDFVSVINALIPTELHTLVRTSKVCRNSFSRYTDFYRKITLPARRAAETLLVFILSFNSGGYYFPTELWQTIYFHM